MFCLQTLWLWWTKLSRRMGVITMCASSRFASAATYLQFYVFNCVRLFCKESLHHFSFGFTARTPFPACDSTCIPEAVVGYPMYWHCTKDLQRVLNRLPIAVYSVFWIVWCFLKSSQVLFFCFILFLLGGWLFAVMAVSSCPPVGLYYARAHVFQRPASWTSVFTGRPSRLFARAGFWSDALTQLCRLRVSNVSFTECTLVNAFPSRSVCPGVVIFKTDAGILNVVSCITFVSHVLFSWFLSVFLLTHH